MKLMVSLEVPKARNTMLEFLSTLNREELKPNARVALHRSSQSVVDVLPADTDASVQMMKMTERPDVTYADIGGMDIQK